MKTIQIMVALGAGLFAGPSAWSAQEPVIGGPCDGWDIVFSQGVGRYEAVGVSFSSTTDCTRFCPHFGG